jgi:NTP pyrophosphatase (non-canonical NTP hydrolase)
LILCFSKSTGFGREAYNGKNHAILQKLSKNIVMTIQDAQQQVDQWIKTIGVRYFSELTNMVILAEEVGELARHIARIYGDQSYKEGEQKPAPPGATDPPVNAEGWEQSSGGGPLADEMADILWVIICLANQTGVDLSEALLKNFEKKNIRDAKRHHLNEKLKGNKKE